MTGIVTVSLEVELGWGTHDQGRYDHLSADSSAEEDALLFILELCEKYNIPISFNVVGHLLHESCPGHHQGPYQDDWWDGDPGTDYETDPLFYNPKIIDIIRDSEIQHEICTHTYSHILCERESDMLLDHELATVDQIYKTAGLSKPRSIVTPRHQRPAYEILKNNDIKTIRTPIPDYQPPAWTNTAGVIGSYFWTLFRQHPVTDLASSEEITQTYCTPHPSLTASHLPNGQRAPHPAFRLIPRPVRQRIHMNYLQSAIDRAAQSSKHIHFWTHLHNMANKHQYPAISQSLSHLAKRRNQGKVTIKRMDELPEIRNQEARSG